MKNTLTRSLFMIGVALISNCGPQSENDKACPPSVTSTYSRLSSTLTTFNIVGATYSNEKKLTTLRSMREDCRSLISVDETYNGCKISEHEKFDLKEIKTHCPTVMIEDCPGQLIINFGKFAKDYRAFLTVANTLSPKEQADKKKVLLKSCEDFLVEHANIEKCLMTAAIYEKNEVRDEICGSLRK